MGTVSPRPIDTNRTDLAFTPLHTHTSTNPYRLSHVVVREDGRVPPQARPALEGEVRRRISVEDPEVSRHGMV